ncbi:TetR/AcrR family transcriptional regulator [Actinomycetes bacterium KLBMP 9759]
MRSHTGRRRNDEARRAILDAAADLLRDGGPAGITIDRIASEAGVGRQTIYRWWPSKGAVLAEAMTTLAAAAVAGPWSGTLAHDLHTFIAATFRAAGDETTAGLLRATLSEALRDEPAASALADFTARRREQLATLIAKARRRGEIGADADVDLVVEQVFGVLWYRIAVTREPLRADLADRLTAAAMALLR